MVDHARIKLGKKPARIDPRTLKLGRYLTAALPLPPTFVLNSRGFSGDWGMLGNDDLGDCTCAAVAHGHQVGVLSQIDISAKPGIIMPSVDAVIDIYSRWCGYNPADPSTDQGGVELDVLNLWRKQGFMGRQIIGYASIDPQNQTHVKQAIQLFGGVYIGLAMPSGWQDSPVWDAGAGDAGSLGGHAVFCPDYDAREIVALTWGTKQRISWTGFAEYADECYGVLFADFKSPFGFDQAALMADLQAVTA